MMNYIGGINMNVELIQAEERVEKTSKLRKNGYVPGVIYGAGIEGTIHIKFNMLELQRLLTNSTVNSRLQVLFRGEEKLCVLKEIQVHPVTGNIIHVDLQVLNKNNQVRLKVPVIFNGRHSLEVKQLILQVMVNELEVQGMISSLPDYIHIDVSGRSVGERILAKEVKLVGDVKLMGEESEVLAVVSVLREKEAEKDKELEDVG
jgi:large subunit ribosomal protein L25